MDKAFKDLTLPELQKKRDDLEKELQDHRFDVILGHVDNPLRKRTLRRQIASLNTILHEYQVGIRKE
jgi:large subunit ribosomal protein L29